MARTVDVARAARRREQIVRAAAGLFGTYGYTATPVSRIAAEAGMSTAAVFYWFEDKAAVFRAVFERDLPRIESLLREASGVTDPVEALHGVLDALAADSVDESAPGLLTELFRRADHDPALVAVMTATDEAVVAGLERLVARGIATGQVDPTLDPRESARWTQALVDAVYLHAAPGRDLRAQLRRTVNAYLAPTKGDLP
ncbi:TetR/AcrR family transcriptional regulator [Isoptericola sp. BMS4]|uniref:TetR/AcrR family transcriptional regulator n=1 Tax=Isoptericola sp. BMS4 TaxID=2527875 RepID=UPI00141E860A|nr:TetR/AcrR family transcriptional regulator [Isoptericola sp. BMS4]